MGQGSLDLRRGTGRVALVLVVLVAATAAAGCSRYKKLSRGGSVPEVLMYDVLGRDRPANEYYELVRSSHKDCDFCYRCGDDPFLVDKNIDAVQRLGKADFPRLEGQAEVVELLTEVLLEDCSALARSSSAGSLTRMGVKLPTYAHPRIEDTGDGLLRDMQALDALHANGGRRCPDSPAARQQVIATITRIGNYEFPGIFTTKNAVRFFYSRPYLVNEGHPPVRQAIDTALVKRLSALIRDALQAAVEDPVPDVRADAVRGLKVLAEREAVEGVVRRLEVEPAFLVRLEIAEYLGRVGTREGVLALLALLDDANASVRHKARQALGRIAGADHGPRSVNWQRWAQRLDPTLDLEPEDEEEEGPPFGPGP